MPLAVLWELSSLWFEGRLNPDFTPRPVADSQRLLERFGLGGPFWALT